MKIDHTHKNSIIMIKGAGEKASAVAHRLYLCGFRRILMTDIPFPTAERRGVSFCEALHDGQKDIGGVAARRTEISTAAIEAAWSDGNIAVLADPAMQILENGSPAVFIDAVMAKQNTGTSLDIAPLVIALGPGFLAGRDAHYVIETNPNSLDLGRLFHSGSAEKNTGIPTPVQALTLERLIKAPASGVLKSSKDIGDTVKKDELFATVGGHPLHAGISGVIWGIVRDGLLVRKGQKIGDIDPRGKREFCFRITPQARAIAGGVLEGILRFQNGRIPDLRP